MSRPLWAFGVDLEDPHDLPPRDSRLVELTQALVDFLGERGATGTFFVVGELARRHPDLVGRIAAAGHEIACHSDQHRPLRSLGPTGFAADTSRARAALAAAGAPDVRGYRAPFFSMSRETSWAYEVLAEQGFAYSSSILPARNPIGGWAGFGRGPRPIGKVLELPVTLHPLLRLPLGGVYLRALPWAVLAPAFQRVDPVLSYVHPYDLDQSRAHPGFARFSPYGIVMRMGRAKLLSRLARATAGYRLIRYDRLADRLSREMEHQQCPKTIASS